MRTAFIFLVCVFFHLQSYAQRINLKNTINKIYNKNDVKNFVTKNLCYVIPWEINFIDTTNNSAQPVNILYFKSIGLFKKHLEEKGKAKMLRVKFDDITNSEIIMTVSIGEVNSENYSERFKLLEYIDERRVSLRYDHKTKKWIYKKLIHVVKF